MSRSYRPYFCSCVWFDKPTWIRNVCVCAGHWDLCGDGEGDRPAAAGFWIRAVWDRTSRWSQCHRVPAALTHTSIPTDEGFFYLFPSSLSLYLRVWEFFVFDFSVCLFQDDIRNVLKEGRLLLSNLETVKASKRDIDEERDLKSDMDTVQRSSVNMCSTGWEFRHHRRHILSLTLTSYLTCIACLCVFQAPDSAPRHGGGVWWLLWETPPEAAAVPPAAALWTEFPAGGMIGVCYMSPKWVYVTLLWWLTLRVCVDGGGVVDDQRPGDGHCLCGNHGGSDTTAADGPGDAGQTG